MAYNPKHWVCGETVTADDMNRIENGIRDAEEACCLPELEEASEGMVLTVVDGHWQAEALPVTPSELPAVTSDDDGMVLTVVDGQWEKAEPSGGDCGFEIGSIYVSSTNTNPSSTLGGTWTLVDKAFAPRWITDAVTFNASVASNGDGVVMLRDHAIEMRLNWKNVTALSDNDETICTIDFSKIGISDGSALHIVHPVGYNDGCHAIGMFESTGFGTSGATSGTIKSVDWVTRESTYPATTGESAYLQFVTEVVNTTGVMDSFCDKFYWKRTA